MPRLIFFKLLLVCCTASACSAGAQTSIYATAGLANYGFTHLATQNESFKGDTGGFAGGAFRNFPIQSRVTVGVDGRGGYSPGLKGGSYAAAAFRVGFVPHRNPLRPYLQLGGGVVHSSYTAGSTKPSVTNGALQLLFGLDIRLNPRFDLRAVEYGAEAGGGEGVHAGLGFLQAGIVYHLPSSRRP